MKKSMTLFAIPLLTLMMSASGFSQNERRPPGITEENPPVTEETPPNVGEESLVKRLQRICAKDIKDFCSNVTPGGMRIAACLKAHDDKITSTCREELQVQVRTHINDIHRRMTEFNDACRSEIDRFCKNVRAGEGRMTDCLEQHRNDLSPRCQEKTTEMRDFMSGRMQEWMR